MKTSRSSIPHLAAACVIATSAAIGAPAWAADPPDFTVEFPAGLACSSFALRLELWECKGQFRELKDKNGYLRALFAGTGNAFRLTNPTNNKSISAPASGASQLIQTYLADGSQVYTNRGHVLLIWFPSDIPAGPWTVLNSGRVVFSLSPAGVGTLKSMTGDSTDVCAALS